MEDTGKLTKTNWRGKEETREVNYTLDTRNHIGEPGWALLVVAANTHLSVTELLTLLDSEGVGRSRSWVSRRRWLFEQPGAGHNPACPIRDGKHGHALKIMAANPTLSVRQLTKLLSESGITRGREWVRCHRCDG